MADEADIANDYISRQVNEALEAFRQNSKVARPGAKHCVECGELVLEARRKLGFAMCLPCAEEDERRKSLFANY